MKHLRKIMKHCFHFSSVIIVCFIAAVCFLSCERKNDKHFNTPKYHTLASYQQDGGTFLDYYLGYTLLEGYDTQTEPDDEGMVSSTSEEIQNGLYTFFIAGLLVFGLFFVWIYLYEDKSYKVPVSAGLWSLVLLLVSIQFLSYFIREGYTLFL